MWRFATGPGFSMPASAKVSLAARSGAAALSWLWNHLIDKDSLKIKVLGHVLIEKVEQLFRDSAEVNL